MTTDDIRDALNRPEMDANDFRRAVDLLCDRHDALVAAASALRDYAVNNPKDIRDIPDEIYVPFVSALGASL